jgi:hypothetical protein
MRVANELRSWLRLACMPDDVEISGALAIWQTEAYFTLS